MSDVFQVAGEDLQKFRDTMTLAFAEDPVGRYFWPQAAQHLEGWPRFVDAYCGSAFTDGTAWFSSNYSGGTAWLGPEGKQDEEALDALFTETLEPEKLEELEGVLGQIGELHPEEPHWYLPMIGVDPGYRGQGLGGKLLAHVLEMVDHDGLPAFLESSNPRNLGLYERHGFRNLGPLEIGGRPLMTPMLRPAQN